MGLIKENNIRTYLLVKESGIDKLSKARIIVFGVGGVGGYVVEALARAGVNNIDVVDRDVVSESNINRQIIANYDTIGQLKVDAIKNRLQSINRNINVNTYPIFYLEDNSDIDLSKYDYIIDAIDTITAKINLVVQADKLGIPIISAMGAGNRLDPGKFEITDIYKTSNCHLARVMRRELKKRKINKLKVVYSKEIAIKPLELEEDIGKNKKTPGSISYNPGICGLMIAGKVINDLLEDNNVNTTY